MTTPTDGMARDAVAASRRIRSWSWNCPTTSSPVDTSVVSWRSAEKTRTSSWLTSVSTVMISPSTRTTVPVTPAVRPATTLTWSPCSKYFSTSSILNDSFCVIRSCRGRMKIWLPLIESTSPSKSRSSPSLTRTTSPLMSTMRRLWMDVMWVRVLTGFSSSPAVACSNILSSSSSGWTSLPSCKLLVVIFFTRNPVFASPSFVSNTIPSYS
mmetsp:Transcript_41804/g.95363  ORF Transcript_41804/g.95363 Transcript_41804/m.95363 type:complete len:211 (+) Transcript_41804:398-1030(+)